MRFVETPLQDAYVIDLDPKEDSRGAFCRLFCSQLLQEQGIADIHFAQVNLSDNTAKGTLRGLHYQAEPHVEAKIVYCLQGSAYDVIVDLRPQSTTYLKHFGMRLSCEDSCALYIPKGFAHGFLTLEENSRLLYLMSDCYQPGFERGYRYDDPAFDIRWPLTPTTISERDQSYIPFGTSHALC